LHHKGKCSQVQMQLRRRKRPADDRWPCLYRGKKN